MSERSKLLAYLQLLRIPNVFTAMADIAMGFLFVSPTLVPLGGFLLLLLASSLLYLSGMVFNDVFDFEADRQERPQRPIPSGQVAMKTATMLAMALMLLGVLIGGISGLLFAVDGVPQWRTALIAVCLSIFILIYDKILKKTPFGPIAMGGCRTLNVFLGMSLFASIGESPIASFGRTQWAAALGIGIYIAGVTWFAKTEARESNRLLLLLGMLVMILGITCLGTLPFLGLETQFSQDIVWPMLLVLIMFSVIRRCSMAIVHPVPERVQAAVKLSIFSLIVLDAAVCLALRGPLYGIFVLALLVPTVLLGRIVYST